MIEPLLTVKNLYGGYHRLPIVKNVSLEIKQGDFIGIIGPNGSGKTTLLRLLSRILTPQKGTITLSGEKISGMKLKEFCKRTAFVPQDTLVNFSFTAYEIVLLGRIPHLGRLETETKKDFAIAEKSLRLTDTLSLKEKMINELSAGERQRVMIAKALTQEPVLLFLDEPTSHLDIGHQIKILNLIRGLNKGKRLTIAIVLHDLNLASEYCSKILLLNNGSIFKIGKPAEVLTYENIEEVYRTVVLVNKNPVSGNPHVLLAGKEKAA